MWQLIFAMVIWGTLGLFVLKSGYSSIDIAFYRCLIGACLLMPYCWYKGFLTKEALSLKIALPIVFGGLFVVLNWVLLFESFRLSSITLGNVSYYLQPVFLVILGRLLFKEEISLVKAIFIGLTLCGVLLTMDLSMGLLQFNAPLYLGVSCALLAGLFYSIATVIAKKSTQIMPATMTLLQLIVGTLVLSPFVSVHPSQWIEPSALYVLILGVVHTVVAFILYYESVKKLPTTTIAVISYVDPIVAIVTDMIFYHRELNTVQIAGIAITLISSYFVIHPQGFKKLAAYLTKTLNFASGCKFRITRPN